METINMPSAESAFPSVKNLRAPKGDVAQDNTEIEALVSKILTDVRARGDEAVLEYSTRCDQSDTRIFEATRKERESAVANLDFQTRADTEFAIDNVRRFAEAQLATMQPLDIEATPGAFKGHRIIPIERASATCPVVDIPFYTHLP